MFSPIVFLGQTMSIATQSSTLNSIVEAIQFVLEFNTELNTDYVIESYDDEPQRKGEPYCVYFRLLEELPFPHPGAGRIGSHSLIYLEVVLYTRLVTDIAGGDPYWSRDLTRGNLVMRETIRNCLNGNNLFSSYDTNTGIPTGQPLTIEPLTQLASERFAKKSPKDKTFGESRQYYVFRYVQPLRSEQTF